MKQVVKIILSMLVVGIFTIPTAWAQKGKKVAPSNISLAMHINFDDKYLAIIKDLREETVTDLELPIDKTGNVTWKSTNKTPGFIKVSFIPKARNKQLGYVIPVYVQAGNQLKMNLNYTDSTYVTMVSSNFDANNKALYEYSNFTLTKLIAHFKNFPPTLGENKHSVNEFITKADDLVKKFNIKNEPVKQYLNVWSMNNYIGGLFNLPPNMRKKGVTEPEYYTLPKSLTEVYNNDIATMFNESNMYINQYITIAHNISSSNKDPFAELPKRFEAINKYFTNKALVTKLFSGNIEQFIRGYKIKPDVNFDDEIVKFKQFLSYVKDEKVKTDLINDFSNLKYTLKGASLPTATFKDRTGKEVSLQQFAGKFIYIDLWASWCKPCIGEIPSLHALEKDYKDKNIVFVSISLDANKTDWKNKMDELKLEGHQFELGNSQYDKLMNVSGIPHFILYNPEGKLEIYSAPRPSSKEIRTLFDRLAS